jgi:hypothetical protein
MAKERIRAAHKWTGGIEVAAEVRVHRISNDKEVTEKVVTKCDRRIEAGINAQCRLPQERDQLSCRTIIVTLKIHSPLIPTFTI